MWNAISCWPSAESAVDDCRALILADAKTLWVSASSRLAKLSSESSSSTGGAPSSYAGSSSSFVALASTPAPSDP